MKKWKYKIMEFECMGADLAFANAKIFAHISYTKATSWTGKEKMKKVGTSLVGSKGIEALFDNLGKEGWELIGILPLLSPHVFAGDATGTTKVYFIFKRSESYESSKGSQQEKEKDISKQSEKQFDILLNDCGPKKIPVIKLVRSITGKNLRDAKRLIDKTSQTPQILKEKVAEERAEEIKSQLSAMGAKVKLVER